MTARHDPTRGYEVLVGGVAFLLGNLGGGGSETKTVRMANRFAVQGYDVHVIYLGAPHTLRSEINDGVSVLFLERRGKFSIRAYRRLRRYVAEKHIETVFCINHYPLIYGWPACRFGYRRRRCIAAVNTYEFTSSRDRFFMKIYTYILRRCDQVIFGSRAQQELWLEIYELDPERSEVIYNGVDVDYFSQVGNDDRNIRYELDIDKDAIVIGCVAHLRPEKAHGDLIAAMEILVTTSSRPLALLLIGEGPEERQLRALVDSRGIAEQVRFCGRAADVRPYLRAMDIFVLPSSSEVFSNAILEAMSMHLPVVCTAVGGSVEMVQDGLTGLTYPRNEVDRLVGALSTLISDNEKRRQFGERGALRATEVFSLRKMDEQYAKVIKGPSTQKDHD